MKKILSAVSVVLFSCAGFAKTLSCDYSNISTKTSDEVKYTRTMPVTPETSLKDKLDMGKFGNMNVDAATVVGQVVVTAKYKKSEISSTEEGKANLRLQTPDAIYEVFCRLVD